MTVGEKEYNAVSIGGLLENISETDKKSIGALLPNVLDAEKKTEAMKTKPKKQEKITLESVLPSTALRRQKVVNILDQLLGAKESVIVSISKVIALSGMDKRTFQKYLSDIRGVEFVVTARKCAGTEIRRRVA